MDPISTAFALAQFAPQVIKWISGSEKAAEAAQKVVSIAEAVTGQTGRDSVDSLEDHPDLALQFRLAIIAQESEMNKAYLGDVQHAREQHRGHWMPWVLTIALAAMVSGTVAALFAFPTPPDNKEVVFLIVGQLLGAFSTAVAFWLGSSQSSTEKNAVIFSRGR